MGPLVDRLQPLAGKRVLVTGMSGFKGSWLTVWLKMLGSDVVGLSLKPDTQPSLFTDCHIEEHSPHHVVDVRDRSLVIETIERVQPSVVFHLAAQPLVLRSYDDPIETFDTNVTGSLNVLEAVRKCSSVRVLVYVTSDKCYANDESGRPYVETDSLGGHDPYSASKAAAEVLFGAYWSSFYRHREEIGAVSVRSGNVIGGGDWSDNRLVPDCIRALNSDKSIILRSPGAVRPWQHVLDPLKGYLLLAADLINDPQSRVGAWNFGPDTESFHNVERVARQIVDIWGRGHVEVESNASLAHEASLLFLDSTKSRELLGWRPTYSFTEAIAATVEWYRARLTGISARALCEQEIRNYMEVSP